MAARRKRRSRDRSDRRTPPGERATKRAVRTTRAWCTDECTSSTALDDLEFEWDPSKAKRVEDAHGISFEEVKTVFADPLAVTIFDEEHAGEEDRWITIGSTTAGRLVVVAHTDRGSRIRLITARPATPAETRAYEQGEDA